MVAELLSIESCYRIFDLRPSSDSEVLYKLSYVKITKIDDLSLYPMSAQILVLTVNSGRSRATRDLSHVCNLLKALTAVAFYDQSLSTLVENLI